MVCSFSILPFYGFLDWWRTDINSYVPQAKPHFWVTLILQSIEMLPWVTVFKRIPMIKYSKRFFIKKDAIEARKTHMAYTRDKIIKFAPPSWIRE